MECLIKKKCDTLAQSSSRSNFVLPLYIAEAESVKVKEMTNGGIELKELLKEYTAASDYEDDEFELNIYGKR